MAISGFRAAGVARAIHPAAFAIVAGGALSLVIPDTRARGFRRALVDASDDGCHNQSPVGVGSEALCRSTGPPTSAVGCTCGTTRMPGTIRNFALVPRVARIAFTSTSVAHTLAVAPTFYGVVALTGRSAIAGFALAAAIGRARTMAAACRGRVALHVA